MPYTELLLRPERDKKLYRLKCRVVTAPYPPPGELQLAVRRGLEMFVADMEKQGWTWLPNVTPKMTGPYVPVRTQTIHVMRAPSSREMFPLVAQGQGQRFRAAKDGTSALTMPIMEEVESWEYELTLAFFRPQIMTEVPDAHEVQHR